MGFWSLESLGLERDVCYDVRCTCEARFPAVFFPTVLRAALAGPAAAAAEVFAAGAFAVFFALGVGGIVID